MIQRILEEINKNRGFVSLNELAERLELDPNVLSGIMQTLNRNRDLKVETGMPDCSHASCPACSVKSMPSEMICGCQVKPKRSQSDRLS